MELVGRSTDNHGIWKVEMNPEKYDWIIFNAGDNGESQTVDIHYTEDAGTKNVLVYVADSASGGRSFDGSESLYINAAAVDWWRNDGAILTMTLTAADGTETVLTLSQAEGAVYGAVIPAGSYTSLVLSRLNPEDPESVWNSTGPIPVPAQGNYIESFDNGSAQASWGFWPSGSYEKVTVTFGKALSKVCGHTAYTIHSENGLEQWICDLCGKTFRTDYLEDFRFDDVKDAKKFYFTPVYWALRHDPQITNGTTASTFSPDKTCTRGEVVTFLWRTAGCPEPTSNENPFTDVKSGKFYYKAVLWAVEQGITKGTSETSFEPNAPLHPGPGGHLPVAGQEQPQAREHKLPLHRCKQRFLLQGHALGGGAGHHQRHHQNHLLAE